MDKTYKKFLDKYVGDTFTLITVHDISRFFVVSNKGETVLSFYVILSTTGTNNFHLFRSDKLCRTMGAAFGLDDDESMKVVRDWIGDTLGIKKVSDLSSFITEFI
jgi:hypothetical protein